MSRVVTQRYEAGLNVNGGALILAGGVTALGFYLYYQAKQTVKDVATAVDPTDENNIVNTAAKKLAAALTGQNVKDVSFAPEVKVNTDPGVFTMTQAQKLAWLDKAIATQKSKVLAATTAADKRAAASYLIELQTRRAAVAAGAQ